MTAEVETAHQLTRQRRMALLLLGLLLAGAAVWAEYAIVHRQQWAVATAVQLIASAALAWLLGAPFPAKAAAPEPARPLERWEWGLGLFGAIAGAGVYFFAAAELTVDWTPWFGRAALIGIGGLVLWTAGLAVLDRRRGRFFLTGSPLSGVEWAAMIAVVALAFFMRFYRFDYFPPANGVSTIEEAQTGMGGLLVLHGLRPWEFLFDRWLAAAGIWIGGTNLTALRVPFAIASALTVVPLYWLLRCLVNRWIAVLTAALFAVCHWHLIYARYAHNIFFTTIVVVFVLFLLVRARLDGRLAPYPIAGALTGLTLYEYAGYRGTFLLVGLFVLVELLRRVQGLRAAALPADHRQAQQRLWQYLLGAGVLAVAFVAVVPPLVRQVRANPNYSYFEAADRSLLNHEYYSSNPVQFVQERVKRIRATAMIFNHEGDDTYTMNANKEPMLDPFVGALFVLAFFYALLHWRHRDLGYFLAVFLFVMIGGAIFVQNLDVRRLQGAVPILYVLVAFLLDRIRAATGRAGAAKGAGRAALALGGIALFVASAQSNYRFFFDRFIHNAVVRSNFKNAYTIGITHLHSLPADAFQLQVSNVFNFFGPSDYAWWRGDATPGEVTTDLLPLLNGAGSSRWSGRDVYVALFEPFDGADVRSLLRAAFPNAACHPLVDPDNPNARLTSCAIGDGVSHAPPSLFTIRARYFYGDEPKPFLERLEPAIAFALSPDACRAPLAHQPCRAEWEGVWDVPDGGLLTLNANAMGVRAPPQITVDDKPLTDPQVRLATGPHRIRVVTHYLRTGIVGTQLTYVDPRLHRRVLVRMGEGSPEPRVESRERQDQAH